MRRVVLALAVLAVGGATVLALVLVPSSSVSAEPATTTNYPSGAVATRYSGLAFDTCTAPSLTAIKAWASSPYRAVGIYIGGVSRTCAQPQLTASWVTAVSKLGWRLLPIYKGRQPPCGGRPTDPKISPSGAATQGTAAADDAVAKAKALGMLPGSGFYNDIEHYDASHDSTCRTTVLKYLSAWTKELHRLGYVSGAYVNLSSGAQDLSATYTSTSYARPDALWIARYDGNSSLTGWSGISNSKWAVHQRAKQYLGDTSETYGGVRMSIDRDRLDAPVATVAYGYTVTSRTALSAHSGPAAGYPVVRTYAPGSTVRVICQTPGSTVGTTGVWDKLSDGTYVTDYYVSTPSNTTYSRPLPRCSYPYQVTSANGLNKRTGPGATYSIAGNLPNGALAWIVCQRLGSPVGTTRVWNKLDDGYWVSDYYVATPSNTTYSRPIPRC